MLDESALRRYATGLSGKDERTRIEEEIFGSAERFEEVQAIEAEVADEYAAGELTPEERHSFEQLLTSNDRLRRQVALARALRAAGGQRVGAAAPAARPSSDVSAIGWLPIAAGFILVVLGVLATVWLRDSSTGDPTPRVTQAEPSPAPPAPTPAPVTPAPAPPPSPRVVALTLFGSSVRSGTAPAALTLPPDAAEVEFRLMLEPGDEFPAYDAQLSSPDGRVAWTGRSLTAQRSADGTSVAARVPATRLASGRHELLLTGRPRTGRPEDLGVYRFVIR